VTRLRALNPFVKCLGLSATLGNPEELASWLGGRAFVDRERVVPQTWEIVPHGSSEDKLARLVEQLARTQAGGGQSIVFVQSRPRAESVTKHLLAHGFAAAAHHAGLGRTTRLAAEGEFRRGTLRILVATPTLSVGVNIPARAAHLFDLQRWAGDGFEPLSCNEVWQLAGRAGRRGLDKVGEVVL
jgi:helicase